MKSFYDSSPRHGVKQRLLKLKLFESHKGKCFYCKKDTVIQCKKIKNNFPPNMATVEHIYNKYDIRRSLSRKTVLACYSCNQEKIKNDGTEIFTNYYKNMPEINILTLIK